jgi:hypothetical protein
VKIPVPVASEVFESLIVGFAVVAQQVPLAEITPAPAGVIFPPETAVIVVTDVTAVVVTVGTAEGIVVNERSFP